MSSAKVFIAIEYADGPTLRELLRGGAWSAEAAHMVVGEIAQALNEARAPGIVHIDLKPQNIMLVPGDRCQQLKVLDFRLASSSRLEREHGVDLLSAGGDEQKHAPVHGTGADAQAARITSQQISSRMCLIASELLAGRLPLDSTDTRKILHAVHPRADAALAPACAPTLAAQRAALDHFFAGALTRGPEARPADAGGDFFAAFRAGALFGRATPTRASFSAIHLGPARPRPT